MPQAAQLKIKRRLPYAVQSFPELDEISVVNFADETQGQMQILWRDPLGTRQPMEHTAERIYHLSRHCNRYEQPGQGSFNFAFEFDTPLPAFDIWR